jgi:hypothetical protein
VIILSYQISPPPLQAMKVPNRKGQVSPRAAAARIAAPPSELLVMLWSLWSFSPAALDQSVTRGEGPLANRCVWPIKTSHS